MVRYGVMNRKKNLVYINLLNMDISLIMALIFCMEICVHITEICLEGIASQILIEDLVLIL